MEMQRPMVSVIVPCYTYGEFLPETLDSLLAQTYRDWECILVINGSDPGTREVAERYASSDPRFRLLPADNRGPAAARNDGSRIASGEYIQFLDADDLMEARKMEIQLAYLQQHPEVGLVYGEVRYFTHGRPEERRFSLHSPDRDWMPRTSGKGPVLLSTLLRYNIMTIQAPLLRRNLLEACGGMDEQLMGFEDWDLWLRMALLGAEFRFLPEAGTISLVRTHPGSLNQDQNTMRRYLLRVWEKALRSGKLSYTQRLMVWGRMEEEFGRMVVSGRAGQALVSTRFRMGLWSGLPIFYPLMKIIRSFRGR